MKQILYFLSLAFLISLYSCTDNEPEIEGCNELFFSSFETLKGFEDFTGNGYYRSDDVTNEAGDSSLVICGGCIGPHLYFDLGPFDDAKEIKLDFMARVEQAESSLSMSIVGSVQQGQYIVVSDTLWTHYQTEELFLLPAEEILRIEFFSGGIAAINTYYDLFTVCEDIK